jgi:hypothetical protein
MTITLFSFSPSEDASIARWEALLDRIEIPLGSSASPSREAMQKTLQLFRSELLTQVRRADAAEEETSKLSRELSKLRSNHFTFPKD